jgi:poly(3-hydroxybutyrate) depolymerase
MGQLVSFDQMKYVETGYTSETSALYKEGYVYVPDSCMSNGTTTNSNNCQLHVSFHGCEQTIDDIGQQFLLETGYNRWAAVNNLIILYPQV